mmetsp:Transcript_15493/g.25111  ORF Transcript_15493/g.25111 Transcript_15493/m.25111 type:complete len:145 (-) Transcript_15493:260-694(-)
MFVMNVEDRSVFLVIIVMTRVRRLGVVVDVVVRGRRRTSQQQRPRRKDGTLTSTAHDCRDSEADSEADSETDTDSKVQDYKRQRLVEIETRKRRVGKRGVARRAFRYLLQQQVMKGTDERDVETRIQGKTILEKEKDLTRFEAS